MVWLALILMAVWLLGVVTAYTLGGFIHILLVLSLAILLIQFTMGQREA
ncbi:MAG TPA: lmo0937 family membrane protein [Bryobacteraceae bacterium]|nr:lmo0937 family membrane protein [Bryobacteraceae bacterium]